MVQKETIQVGVGEEAENHFFLPPLGILVKNRVGDKREWDACWVKHQLVVLSSKTLKPVGISSLETAYTTLMIHA